MEQRDRLLKEYVSENGNISEFNLQEDPMLVNNHDAGISK
jgi:hypothetical protein